jgi:hypothetical protein
MVKKQPRIRKIILKNNKGLTPSDIKGNCHRKVRTRSLYMEKLGYDKGNSTKARKESIRTAD